METLLHPLICFMGPSASGKTFISEKIFQKTQKVITTTTRPKRPAEKNGQDYYFIRSETFQEKMSAGEFFETDQYADQYYGTERQEVLNRTNYRTAFAIVTVPGFYHLQSQIFPIVPVYLQIDEKTFLRRLKRRELPIEETKKRVALFKEEAAQLTELKKNVPNLIVMDNTNDPALTIYHLKERLRLYR